MSILMFFGFFFLPIQQLSITTHLYYTYTQSSRTVDLHATAEPKEFIYGLRAAMHC